MCYSQIKYKRWFFESAFGAYGWQRANIYGSDNSLNVNWNAENGFYVNNWNRTDQNWNLGAVPEVSLLLLYGFDPAAQHPTNFLQSLLKQQTPGGGYGLEFIRQSKQYF